MARFLPAGESRVGEKVVPGRELLCQKCQKAPSTSDVVEMGIAGFEEKNRRARVVGENSGGPPGRVERGFSGLSSRISWSVIIVSPASSLGAGTGFESPCLCLIHVERKEVPKK